MGCADVGIRWWFDDTFEKKKKKKKKTHLPDWCKIVLSFCKKSQQLGLIMSSRQLLQTSIKKNPHK